MLTCLLCTFCSSCPERSRRSALSEVEEPVPGFAVSLPSLHASRQTSLRLANASGRTPLSEAEGSVLSEAEGLPQCIRDLHPQDNSKNFCILRHNYSAHAGHTYCAKKTGWAVPDERSVLSAIFGIGDRDEVLSAPLSLHLNVG